jgi:holo-ACP synthase/triphosphoribosyl-dephospho-CoA synthase
MNTDSSQFITGREVAVLDMLNARDRRHAIQQELIRTHNATVISFTLNIPGPIKVFPLGEMTFEEGIRLIDSQLHAWKAKFCTGNFGFIGTDHINIEKTAKGQAVF